MSALSHALGFWVFSDSCSPVQHRIREPLNLAGTAEDPLNRDCSLKWCIHLIRIPKWLELARFVGARWMHLVHCSPGTTNPGLLECPWLGWSRELVQFLDALASVHIRPDILHRFLDEMSRGWCYAGQPLCSDAQGAACTSCTCNFWCGHRCHGPVRVASLKVVLWYTWWGSQSRCFSHRWAKMTGKKCCFDPSISNIMLCGRDSKAIVST